MKLTQTQKLILSAILSLLGSAIVSAVVAAYHYTMSGSNPQAGDVLMFALSTFGLLFGRALYDYVPAHAAQTIQALQDTIQELQPGAVKSSTQPLSDGQQEKNP